MITNQDLDNAILANNIPGVDEFNINAAKLGSVIQSVKYYFPNATDEQIKDFILADWHEGQEHQDWLDTATADEIADWVIGCNPEF